MDGFFEMGGYAFYVWTSFAIVAIVLVANVVAARHFERRALATVVDTEAEERV